MWWSIFMLAGGCVIWLLPRKHLTVRERLEESSNWGRSKGVPMWTRQGQLEFGRNRDLWHIEIVGQDHPPTGEEMIGLNEGNWYFLDVLQMDVVLNPRRLHEALYGIMKYFTNRFFQNSTMRNTLIGIARRRLA
mmetsp:Transcript_8338/g.18064  ORF Transcript_8338/g.18064 Transcript_8338/m.18064 type:complete len:134 (+) Transcript_8338:3-404(+)